MTDKTADDTETEARDLHRNYRPLDWLEWDQLTKPCQDEFRRDARRKLGIVEPNH